MSSAPVAIYIAIDCDGDYGVGLDEETARASYAENIGDANERAVVVREVLLNVPMPKSVIEHVGPVIDILDEPAPEAVTARNGARSAMAAPFSCGGNAMHYEVIESYVWRASDGASASIYGAVPWRSEHERTQRDWRKVKTG